VGRDLASSILCDHSMNNINNIKLLSRNIFYSFPVLLLINNLKKNQILLLLWLILFGIVTQNLGNVLGIPYLFLDPEYMNKVDYKGFTILGISLGIFITSFNITTYILDSFRFPFLGSIRRPFTKFCFNNSSIPFLFTLVYIICIVKFQLTNGLQTQIEVLIEVLTLIVSLALTLYLIFLYFRSTNRDIYKEITLSFEKKLRKNQVTRVNVLRKINTVKKNKYIVNYYLDTNFSFKKVSEFNIYDKQTLLKIFDQNHLNAVIFEVFIILLIIILGLFRDNPYFQIPASASTILLFSIFVMFTGASSYWLRGWAITTLIAMALLFNFFIKHEVVKSIYQAYGINYNIKPTEYSLQKLNEICSPENYSLDYNATVEILNNWKQKFPKQKKPKMIFICTSGGGQRAAVWTTRTLQYVDSTLSGDLMKHSILMTGASGGIVGASYFRELYLRKLNGDIKDLYNIKYVDNISKDILNPIIFSLVVNDIFFRFQKFSDGKYEYLKDRGYAFEQQLNKNTGYILNKTIRDYKIPEQKALIPMMIMSPTVINDGRKLFISPQYISYMANAATFNQRALNRKIKGIEFLRFYQHHDPSNLSFLSALRMSATFPYITPNVELPSRPEMEIMDAGLTDNFGIHDATKFLHVFREWIYEHTSGVIFIVIRDSEKQGPVEKRNPPSIFQKMFTPIGSLYSTWDYLQDFNNDDLMEFSQSWFKGNIQVVNFEYIPKPRYWNTLKEKHIAPEEIEEANQQERAALSWHLTTREKKSLKRTILETNNQTSLIKLKTLLAEEK
jgi:hypothetical protein